MPNLLGLHHWIVVDKSSDDNDIHVTAKYDVYPSVCPKCGVANPRLYMHAMKEQTFMDTPMQGKRVGIVVQRPRYKCRECSETFQQELPDMDEKRRMTRRLVEYIGKASMRRPFTEVAHDVGVHEKTVRLIFGEYAEKLESSTHFETPEILGMDELHLVRRPRLILVNIAEAAIYDLLESRDKQTVVRYLSQMPHRERVRVVAMDMWRPYEGAVKLVLPQATVVIDKFHVVRLASYGLEKVRKAAGQSMTAGQRKQIKRRDRFLLLRRADSLRPEDVLVRDAWLRAIAPLGLAYEAKERFYAIYDAASRADAERLYGEWLDSLTPDLRTAFSELIRAVTNWREPIFNYFDYPVTNALTEAANGVAKVINRQGRGYSFAAVRAKVLFSGLNRVQRPAFGTGRRAPEGMENAQGCVSEDYSHYQAAMTSMRCYGVSIPNLIAISSENHDRLFSTHDSE